jgi:hypothetical protein
MIWTIDEALRHELITVESLDREAGLVKFRLGIIPTVVTAKIVKRTSTKYTLAVSHKIKPAGQSTIGYLPAFRDCSSPGEALHELVREFCRDYKYAVEAGHPPRADWLVTNPYYQPGEV